MDDINHYKIYRDLGFDVLRNFFNKKEKTNNGRKLILQIFCSFWRRVYFFKWHNFDPVVKNN